MTMKQRKLFGDAQIKTIKQIIITHVVLLALFAGIAYAFAQSEEEPVACTMDAKECPDGTFVGRVGPNCEFAPCPSGGPGEVAEESSESDSSNNGSNAPARNQNPEQNTNSRERVEERKAVFEENMANRRAALEARAQERITNLAANLSNRVDAMIARFLNITDRFDSRIARLQTAGVITEDAEAQLALARESITVASNAMADIDETVAAAVTSEDVRKNWQNVREIFQAAKQSLKEAQTHLRSTLATLKTAVAATEGTQGVSGAVQNESAAEEESRDIPSEDDTEIEKETDNPTSE